MESLKKPQGPFLCDGDIASKMEAWGDALMVHVAKLERDADRCRDELRNEEKLRFRAEAKIEAAKTQLDAYRRDIPAEAYNAIFKALRC